MCCFDLNTTAKGNVICLNLRLKLMKWKRLKHNCNQICRVKHIKIIKFLFQLNTKKPNTTEIMIFQQLNHFN